MGSSAKWVISVSKGPPPRSHVLRAPISPMRVAIHACLALRAVIALALAPCHPLFVPREATAPSHLLTSSSAMLAPSNQCRTEAMSPTVGHVSLASTAPQRDFPTLKGTVTLATFACWVPLRRPRQGRRHTLPSMGLAPRVCIASQVPVLVRSPVCLVPSTPALVEHPPRAARSAQVACFAIHPAWSPPQETVLEGFIALQVSAIALPAPSSVPEDSSVPPVPSLPVAARVGPIRTTWGKCPAKCVLLDSTALPTQQSHVSAQSTPTVLPAPPTSSCVPMGPTRTIPLTGWRARSSVFPAPRRSTVRMARSKVSAMRATFVSRNKAVQTLLQWTLVWLEASVLAATTARQAPHFRNLV